MKTITQHLTILFFALIFSTGCDKEQKDIYSSWYPYAVIYKTKGDYFNYVNTWGKDRGPSTIKFKIENGDTLYMGRWRLNDDYVIAVEATPNDYYTNITFGELIGYKDKSPDRTYFPIDSMFKRVIDKDPYLEFWVPLVNGTFIGLDSSLVPIINDYIENGELEKYFKRVK
jgi:hypothetical protein